MVALYMPEATSLGNALRRIRDRAGMSQRALADVSGVERSYISMLENGHRRNASEPIMRNLAAALGVTVGDLYREAEMFWPDTAVDDGATVKVDDPDKAAVLRRLARLSKEQLLRGERLLRIAFLEGIPQDEAHGADHTEQTDDRPHP